MLTTLNAEIAVLYAATFSVAAFHTISPDHWLPFVMLGKSQKWPILKTELVALVAGLGHVGTSVAIALVGIFLGAELSSRFASIAEEITGAALIIFGFAYAVYAWRTGGHVHLIGGHSHGDGAHSHEHSGHSHDHAPALAAAGAAGTLSTQAAHVHDHPHHAHDHAHGDSAHTYDHHTHDEQGHHDHGHDGHSHDYGAHDHDHGDHAGHSHGHAPAAKGVGKTKAAYGPVIIMGLTPCVALLPLAFASAGFGIATTLSVVALFAVATIVPILVLTFMGSVGLSFLKLGWVEKYADVVTGVVIGCIGLMTMLLGL